MVNTTMVMKLQDIIHRISPERGGILGVKSLFLDKSEQKTPKNWLREKGVINKDWTRFVTTKTGLVDNRTDFATLDKCYAQIPKVFRAINMRAAFAIQGGFKLEGNKADVEKLNKWLRKESNDNTRLQIAKCMLKHGDVYQEILGMGESTTTPFLPTPMIRVQKGTTTVNGREYFPHEIVGIVQNTKSGVVLNDWKPEEIAHFKWNSDGTSPYGISEITPCLSNLADKLDMEAVLPRIGKFLYPKVIYKCGKPEAPYNKPQMLEFRSDLEEMLVGGDVIVAGDIMPEVVSPARGVEAIVSILGHTEEQVDLGLNSPTRIISGSADGQASLVAMDAIERDVKSIQDVITTVYEKKIFPLVLVKDDVPTMRWNPMNIETYLRISRTLRQLVGKKQERLIVTPNEARKELGYGEIDKEEVKDIYDMEGGSNEPDEKIQPNGEEDGDAARRGQKPKDSKKPV